MNINTNYGTNGVTGPSTPKSVAKKADQSTAGVSLEGFSALQATLSAVPDVRPEAVDRAKQLISDPSYPSAGIIKQLSVFLAQNLSSTQH